MSHKNAASQKKDSKKLWVRILCGFLAVLMVSSAVMAFLQVF